MQAASSEAYTDPLADLQPATLHALKLTFPGSNPDVRIEPFDPVDTTVSYFLGDDPAQWRPDVPVWSGVRYVDLYPGVDLVLGGSSGGWQFEVEPGAPIGQVRVQIEGAEMVAIDGAVVALEGAGQPLSVALPSAPFVYQAIGRDSQGDALALTVPAGLQPARAPAPDDDPADLIYGTFLGGGSGGDTGSAIVVDGAGNAYVTGYTWSGDFPTTPGAFDVSFNGFNDAFAVKLNPAGSGLVYATFLGGGSGTDRGDAIAVDGAGSAYVTGETRSSDFPTTPDAFDTSFNDYNDAFVAKLNPAGSGLVFGTFLGGGSSHDYGYAIALEGAGSAYVTGETSSSDFPTTPDAFDTSFNGYGDAFVAKLDMSSDQPCCDFDGDGSVDVDDIITIAGLWGQQASVPYDQDDDGWITIIDVQRIARWWDWPVP